MLVEKESEICLGSRQHSALYWLLLWTVSFTLAAPAFEKSGPFLVKGHGFPLSGEGGGCPALLGSAWKGRERGAAESSSEIC